MKTSEWIFRSRQWVVCRTLRALARMLRDDHVYLGLVRRVALFGKVHAAMHFDHFLKGSGDCVTVHTDRLLSEDAGVRRYLYAHIDQERVSGVVPVPQWVFENADWKYALGSVELAWCMRQEELRVQMRGCYRWNPDESRITQPIHQAAHRLSRTVAREFRFAGTQVSLAWNALKPSASSTFVPHYRRVYL